jgi:uncharacterized membrane protein
MRSSARRRVGAGLLGALLGAIVGTVLALNLLIFAGVEGGYEASLPDVFERRPLVGVATVVVFVVPTLLGPAIALRRGRRSDR